MIQRRKVRIDHREVGVSLLIHACGHLAGERVLLISGRRTPRPASDSAAFTNREESSAEKEADR